MKANTASSVLVITLFAVPSVTLAQASVAKPAAPAAAVPVTPNATPAVAAPASGSLPTPGAQAANAEPSAPPAVPAQVSAAAGPAPAQPGEPPTAAPATAVPVEPAPPVAVAPAAAAPAAKSRPRKARYPLSVQFDVMPVWQKSNGFDLFSDKDISTRLGLSAAYDVVEITPRLPLSVELGWTSESLDSLPLAGALDTSFSASNFHGGIKARHQLLSFLAPYASASFGVSRAKVGFNPSPVDTERKFETVSWKPFGMLGAGLALMLPVENAVMLGVSAEGGYLLSGSVPLRLEPHGSSDALPTSGANFGNLGRSGPYLRFGLFVRI